MGIAGKVIAGVVLAPIVILVGGIGGCEARKAYYDWQVRKMCEKDGGVTVFERVTLSREEYKQVGVAIGEMPLSETDEHSRSLFFSTTAIEQLRAANPQIYRRETKIVRRSDRKEISRQVQYGRIGGDFPTFAHPSSFGCSDLRMQLDIEKQTFQLKE
jgi:hypothetical protein